MDTDSHGGEREGWGESSKIKIKIKIEIKIKSESGKEGTWALPFCAGFSR